MFWTRNFGRANLVLMTSFALFICNCSGGASGGQSTGDGGASEPNVTPGGGGGRGSNAAGNAGKIGVGTNVAGTRSADSSTAGTSDVGLSSSISGDAGMSNGGTNSTGVVSSAGMGSGGTNSAGMANVVGGGAAFSNGGTSNAGMGTNCAGVGSAGSPASITGLANPIHVAVGAALEQADGSEARPFPSLADAVVAIRATEAGASPWDGQIIVHEGRYEVLTTVELPLKADVKFLAGVTMAMGSKVSLHASRDVKMLGTQEKRVIFTWLEQDKPWASFTLFVPTSQANVFDWATFEHGGAVTYQGVSVNGALSLEGAGARISNCTFQSNSGDDGLSLGTSPTMVDHSTFFNNAGDGLDIDGPAGQEIAYCVFDSNGNDGLDLGEGSDAWAHDNRMLNNNDTGIEMGEASLPTLDRNLCVGNSMGIGIKDDADPVIRNCTVYGNDYGVVGYHFKAAYGSGKGRISNTIVWKSAFADVALVTDATTKFSYSCIQSGTYSTTVTVGAVTGAPTTGTTLPLAGDGLIAAGAGCDDPLFVNTAASDFHLMSTAGHFGTVDQSWVADAATSPCIDSGDPLADFAAETVPNGGRVDMGIYGGMAEASHSP